LSVTAAAAFLPKFNPVQNGISGATGEMKAGVSHSRRLTVSQAECAVAKNSQRSHGSSVGMQHLTALCAVNLNPRIVEYQVRFPELGRAYEHHQYNSLEVSASSA